MKRFIYIVLLILISLPASNTSASTKQERNFIVEGNKLYRQERYAEAEAFYKKALTVAPGSEVAKFNLAASLLRQAGSADQNKGNSPLDDAVKLLTELEQNAQSKSIVEKASYDLGNVSFNGKQYKEAIEHYKNALRKNPDNDKARQNLRLAQKKLEEQQNQDKNQDKNKDQNKERNKDQNKDQQQQQQQQQQQNKDKQDQQNQNQNKQNQQQKQQQQPQGGISDENANKILKAMENAESATRAKIEARKQKNQEARRRQVTRPW